MTTNTATQAITNTEDIIDSRDIIARIAELEEDDGRDQDDEAELASLHALAEEGENVAEDWEYGATLIRDSYFVEYAQGLAEDIGAIDRDLPWPACHIDWYEAANALKMDYTAIDFDGTTYWVGR